MMRSTISMNADFNVTKEVKKFLPDKKETTEEAMIAFQKWAWDK